MMEVPYTTNPAIGATAIVPGNTDCPSTLGLSPNWPASNPFTTLRTSVTG